MTPDKDLAQCLRGDRVVQIDRRQRKLTDEATFRATRGFGPASVPDFLALTGDTADGIPGLDGFGDKSASVLIGAYEHIEAIPELSAPVDGQAARRARAGGDAGRAAARRRCSTGSWRRWSTRCRWPSRWTTCASAACRAPASRRGATRLGATTHPHDAAPLAGRLGERVSPAQLGKAAEIQVVRMELRLVLDRRSGDLGVSGQISSRPEMPEECKRDVEVTGSRREKMHMRPGEPALGVADSDDQPTSEGQPPSDWSPGRKKPNSTGPAMPTSTRPFINSVHQARALAWRGERADVRVHQQVDVGDDHFRFVLCCLSTKASASSSSATRFSDNGS